MKNGIAIVIAVALLLAGCVRDARKAAVRQTPVNLACVMNPDFSIVHVALAQGYFEAEGLAVNVKPFVVGKDALAALIRGEADLATVQETPLVFAILGGQKLSVVAAVGSSDKNLALIANRASGVAKSADLVGKAIGLMKGTVAEYFLHSFLVANKISDSRVRIIDTELGDMLRDLKSGKIAAAVLWNPLLLEVDAALEGKGTVFSGEGIYTASDLVVGGRSFVEGNPAAMKGLVRALMRGEEFMTRSPEKALKIISSYTGIDEGGLKAMLELFRFRVGIEQSLLLVLEDESRWAMDLRPASYAGMPNYLDILRGDAILSVAPARLRLTR